MHWIGAYALGVATPFAVILVWAVADHALTTVTHGCHWCRKSWRIWRCLIRPAWYLHARTSQHRTARRRVETHGEPAVYH